MENKKKNTATLTFHAPHNYGSMLQAYALQQTIMSLGVENTIIDLRIPQQKKHYQPLYRHQIKSIKDLIRVCIFSLYYKGLNQKYTLFEHFLQNNLCRSQEYHSISELKDVSEKFDIFIVGSDQIWNTSCLDFDWSYFLPFTNRTKIAYAPSMGPNAIKEVNKSLFNTIASNLKHFDRISVREMGTATMVESILGSYPEIVPDPTLLLSKEQWLPMIPDGPIVKGEYILLYTPNDNPNIIGSICRKISKILGLKVIVTQMSWSNYWYIIDPCTTLKLDIGPWQFLNLLFYSKLSISYSFHAVVFALLFHVPFFAIDGLKDNRIAPLLNACKLADRHLGLDEITEKARAAFDVNFADADIYIKTIRAQGIDFLKSTLL